MTTKISNCVDQVGRLSDDLQKIDPSLPTFPLWMRMTTFLGSLCESLSDLQVAVRGDGNGSRGLLERMTAIEGDMKAAKSDIREVLTMMRLVYGMDRDELGKFDENNHPKRRKSDGDAANRLLDYFVKRILPPIIVWVILGFIAFQIAINQHIILLG